MQPAVPRYFLRSNMAGRRDALAPPLSSNLDRIDLDLSINSVVPGSRNSRSGVAHGRTLTMKTSEPTPAAPEDQRQNKSDCSDDHENHSDFMKVDTCWCDAYRET